jgi:CubicO group peptidase (beta-lactamase class C family)
MNLKKKYLILIFCAGIFFFNSCEISRFVIYNVADVNDYKIFPSRITHTNNEKFCFAPNHCSDEIRVPVNILSGNQKMYFDEFLETKKTLAFLIIQNDTMIYEKYFNKCDQSTVIPSFSVAKSVTSTLIGCAIDDGYIKSIEQPVTDYIPELKSNGFDKVTIKHLLQMTSGINFKEGYFHFFHSAPAYYYGINLRQKLFKLKLKSAPGLKFEYASGNAELLGLILERALRTKTVTQYLQEKIWQPLGMEYDASWSIDKTKNGMEKTFCCLNARARDYAKLGRLYLNNGNWNGKQIVSKNWVKESVKIDTANGSAWFYQYQWWIVSDEGDYLARGMLGQFVYVNPAKNLIIVRLGERGGGVNWPEIFKSISRGFETNSTYDILIADK